jgi:hypothetical protein
MTMRHMISKPSVRITSVSDIRTRLDRLRTLGQDQVEAGLAWLSGYNTAVFDAVLAAAETWDGAAPRGAVLVSPAQRAGTGGGVLGSDGLPGSVR